MGNHELRRFPEFIVSTDLDGSLLDHYSYSWRAALPAITRLVSRNIPIVFNTSKTLVEALALQEEIGISGPVIIENGSAIAFSASDYHTFIATDYKHPVLDIDGMKVVVFGCPRSLILAFVKQRREEMGDILEGYGDWDIARIISETGLSKADAELSAKKLFSEPFLWHAGDIEFKFFELRVQQAGLKVLKGGRFFHLQGNTNKAVPLLWLREKMRVISAEKTSNAKGGDRESRMPPKIIALGDNQNDVAMLNAADFPVCVKSPSSSYPLIDKNLNAIFTDTFGPEGWNSAICKLVS
ncbi:MAG: mannosyl-3-phosphoglycerate phosphatase family protein [Lentisphaeria bacterium]|jgi:mannosyl-3-phosphoglycerate phosphatase family protein